MNTWLLPLGDLTPEQSRIVEMSPDQNRVIFGAAGSGKTQILIHRADYLAKTYSVPPERFRVFVFTNVIKEYIKSGTKFLELPEETVSTFDHWCHLLYQAHISRNPPWIRGSNGRNRIDFGKIRLSILELLREKAALRKILDFALVDEGQDLSPESFEILSLAARHVTVFADSMQQIFADGASEQYILKMVGINKRNATLLAAYRNSPYVAQLASYFIADENLRSQYLLQINTHQQTKERPLCFVARNFKDEIDRLAEIIRQRQLMNERVGVIVPTNQQLFGYSKGLQERGIEIEKTVPPRRPGSPVDFEFGNMIPKIATYHSAKGLTFDSVLLPRLINNSFQWINDDDLRRRLIFVGIARGTQWVYLSTETGKEIADMNILRTAEKNHHLTIQEGRTLPTQVQTQFTDDDFDAL
ncbi:MAG: UvrD-helicase domain-containing protein [Dissulfuribacterales bacterium]